jgi:hypothetical protein
MKDSAFSFNSIEYLNKMTNSSAGNNIVQTSEFPTSGSQT